MTSTPRERSPHGAEISPRHEELLWSMRNLQKEMDRKINELEATLKGGIRAASKRTSNKISPRSSSRTPNGMDYSEQSSCVSVESTAEPLLGGPGYSRGTAADGQYKRREDIRSLSIKYRPAQESKKSTEHNLSVSEELPRSEVQGDGSTTLQKERFQARNEMLLYHLQTDAQQAMKAGAVPGSYADVGNPESRTSKEALRKLLEQDDTHEHLYHGDGWASRMAQSEWFKDVTLLIIFVSSIWIAIDTDFCKEDTPPATKHIFTMVDQAILIYFTFEIGVRFLAFADKNAAFKLFNFDFDLVLVAVMVVLTWVMPLVNAALFTQGTEPESEQHQHTSSLKVLRALRLIRLARLVRLVRAWDDLTVLVRGMIAALHAVFSTFVLLTVVIYMFAVFFTAMLHGTGAISGKFENVPSAMVCLLLDGIFNSQAGLIYAMLEVHWSYFVVVMMYECLAFLTIMNMLLGVICNEVTQVAKAEFDARQMQQIRTKLRAALSAMDDDGDGVISMVEFGEMVQKPDVLRVLHSVGVDVRALVESGEFIFLNKGFELSYDDFMEEVLKFRTCNACSVKDTVDLRLFFLYELKQMEQRLQKKLRVAATAPGGSAQGSDWSI